LGLLTLIGALLAGVFGLDGGVMDRGEPSRYETPTVVVTATTVVPTPEGTPSLVPGGAEATSVVGDDEDNGLEATVEPTATSDLTFPPVAPETVTPAVPGLPVTPTPILR
jgi:hypothetical protein